MKVKPHTIRALTFLMLLFYISLNAQAPSKIDSLHLLIKQSKSKDKIDHYIKLGDLYNKAQNKRSHKVLFMPERNAFKLRK